MPNDTGSDYINASYIEVGATTSQQCGHTDTITMTRLDYRSIPQCKDVSTCLIFLINAGIWKVWPLHSCSRYTLTHAGMFSYDANEEQNPPPPHSCTHKCTCKFSKLDIFHCNILRIPTYRQIVICTSTVAFNSFST